MCECHDGYHLQADGWTCLGNNRRTSIRIPALLITYEATVWLIRISAHNVRSYMNYN